MIPSSPELVMENLAWLPLNISQSMFVTELARVNSTFRDTLLAKHAPLAKVCLLSRWVRNIQCFPTGMSLPVAEFNNTRLL